MASVRRMMDAGSCDALRVVAAEYIDPSVLELSSSHSSDYDRHDKQSLDTLISSLSDGWPDGYGAEHAVSTEFYTDQDVAPDLQDFAMDSDKREYEEEAAPAPDLDHNRENTSELVYFNTDARLGQPAILDRFADGVLDILPSPAIRYDGEESKPAYVFEAGSPTKSTGIVDLLPQLENNTNDSFRDFAQAQFEKIERVSAAAPSSDKLAVTNGSGAFARQTSAISHDSKSAPICLDAH